MTGICVQRVLQPLAQNIFAVKNAHISSGNKTDSLQQKQYQPFYKQCGTKGKRSDKKNSKQNINNPHKGECINTFRAIASDLLCCHFKVSEFFLVFSFFCWLLLLFLQFFTSPFSCCNFRLATVISIPLFMQKCSSTSSKTNNNNSCKAQYAAMHVLLHYLFVCLQFYYFFFYFVAFFLLNTPSSFIAISIACKAFVLKLLTNLFSFSLTLHCFLQRTFCLFVALQFNFITILSRSAAKV